MKKQPFIYLGISVLAVSLIMIQWNPYGHVAIVSAVYENAIEITQQNPGPSAPSRIQVEINIHQGTYTLNDPEILGWLHKQ
jgi:surface antigen